MHSVVPVGELGGRVRCALGKAFSGVRAPSTLGAVLRRLVPALAAHTPLLPGADQFAYVDIDDPIRRTYGYAKQGVGIGYSKVKGLNALIGCVSTPLARPVIVAARLRRGAANATRPEGESNFGAFRCGDLPLENVFHVPWHETLRTVPCPSARCRIEAYKPGTGDTRPVSGNSPNHSAFYSISASCVRLAEMWFGIVEHHSDAVSCTGS